MNSQRVRGDYFWHMPRLGAPQAQAPGSDAASLVDDPETAKTESICVTLELSHFLQVTRLEEEATIFSNLVPQSLHSNSNMGMGGLSSFFVTLLIYRNQRLHSSRRSVVVWKLA
jgi:hypothetical protein